MESNWNSSSFIPQKGELIIYARLASPAFTGTPTALTPSTSDDSTKIATTAWVKDQNYLDSIPSASQTVLGGAKIYVDSGGYLCIDTE